MEIISEALAYRGTQGVYNHVSKSTNCEMTFAVYMPPCEYPVPMLWYLSGLTCTYANVMDKGEYRRMASELGVAIICPDTSPRGNGVPDEDSNWQFGIGAGFYLDALQPPFDKNYNMYTYVTKELPLLVAENFDVDLSRQGIMGHSMGGHGALTIALKNPTIYKSASAFSPITQPSTAQWSKGALKKYLGDDQNLWRQYDTVALLEDGYSFDNFLVDQGVSDSFLDDGLRPWLLEAACKKAGQKLTLRMQEGYDHSYLFVSSFMEEHIRWHMGYLLEYTDKNLVF
jgi:S-formylglutathione hydrolase